MAALLFSQGFRLSVFIVTKRDMCSHTFCRTQKYQGSFPRVGDGVEGMESMLRLEFTSTCVG